MPTSEVIIIIKVNNLYKAYLELNKRYYCNIFITLFLITIIFWKEKVKVAQSCSTLCDPHGLYSLWDSPGQNTGVGSFSLLQGIFPTQGLNPGLPHCRQIVLPAEPQPLGILYKSLIEFQDIMRITYNFKEKKKSSIETPTTKRKFLPESSGIIKLITSALGCLWVVCMECAECTSPKFLRGTFLPTNLHTAGLQTFYRGRR